MNKTGKEQFILEPTVEFSTLVELLRWRGLHQSDQHSHTFLVDGETEAVRLTYGELDRQSQAIAALLQSMGTTGERALLLYPPGLEYISGFFGCLYAGVVAVPAYPPRPNRSMSRLQAIVVDAQATVALTTPSILNDIKRRFADTPGLASLRWLVTGDDFALADEWQEPAVSPDTLAFLQYTSGSTGTPKGVMVSHGNLLHNLGLIHQCFGHTSSSQGAIWLPPYHDMGLIGGILQPLYGGFPVTLMSPVTFLQKPFRWLQAISQYKATTSGGPNFAYDLCVRNITPEQRATLDLSSWEVAFTGSELIREQTLEQFAAAFESCGFRRDAFYPCYGMAETTLIASGGLKAVPPVIQSFQARELEQKRVVPTAPNKEDAWNLVGCGQALRDQQIVIVDPDSLSCCSPDWVGEIWISGPSVAQGYWKQPEKTQQTFRAYLADTGQGPFLRTGDLGFLKNGELFVTGRLKDLIIIRGRNHYPQDIELTVERSHPALRPNCGAVFSVNTADEEQLVIVQEIERHYRNLDLDEVVKAIRQAVSENHELQVYAVLLLKPGRIPKTSSGKIQRHACRASFLAGSLDVVWNWTSCKNNSNNLIGSLKKSQTAEAIQVWLVSHVSERLRISPNDIDVREPLVRCGLDSMAVVSISGELEEWLGRRLSPTLAYDYPTIEALARHLAEETDVSRSNSKVDSSWRTDKEAIAVIGIGCRFPGANNPEAFWQLLHNGVDAITEVPLARWDNRAFYDPNPATPGKLSTCWGGFLDQVDLFDAHFFGISSREAERMDPQQRLLLEVSWEALENAGQSPARLAGSQTGVFIGISSSDYSQLQFNNPTTIDAYTGTGNAHSIAANRLSYSLDLHGPSFAMDTACSSSLVAVHLACQSLRNSECNLALAGGVNLILTPQLTIALSQARMMAADGRCKTFDADADGYVRGEGCGIVVLKRLSEALADGDSVLAIIRGSAINQDGLSNGLTAPNRLAQQAVICQALKNAQVAPAQISYVETHGTATSLGDPIEVESLKGVLMQERLPSQPCVLGSVKTNIGHLEAAAGIASLIKVVLCLQHKEIPAHLHLKRLNPYISLEGTPFLIPIAAQPWSKGTEHCLAGVSSFGFGGTNAHVILEEAPVPAPKVSKVERPLHVLTLSAKSENALQDLVRCYQAFLATHPTALLADVCFIANTGRSHFAHRLIITSESTVKLHEQLDAFAAGKQTDGLVSGHVQSRNCPKIAFLFTGQGSQYLGMGRQLYDNQPTFRRVLKRCDELLRPYLKQPLLSVLYPAPDAPPLLHETAYTQPALFALEYALAELWRSWGIVPDAVIGHSLGEYVAACVAGVLSLEDGLKLIAERARLMQALQQDGMMAVVFADEERVSAALAPHKARVAIAAINGPENIAISGAQDAVQAVIEKLKSERIAVQPLRVSHAFHSPLMDPILNVFEQIACQVQFKAPCIPLVSNLTGKILKPEEIPDATYWCRHLREAVQFSAGINTLVDRGYELFVELGPNPTLLSMGKRGLPKGIGTWLPSLKEDRDDWQVLLNTVGALYIKGVDVDWVGFDRDYLRNQIVLPTYPFERKRHWIETSAPHATQDNLNNWLYQLQWQSKPRPEQYLVRSLHIPTPLQIAEGMQSQVTRLSADRELELYKKLAPQLDVLSAAYILKAFRQLGLEFCLHQCISVDALAKQLSIVPQHRRLLSRILEILEEEGVLKKVGSEWEVCRVPRVDNPQELRKALLDRYSPYEVELTLLGRCGDRLAEVLRGECDPLQLLFPEGSLTTAEKLYQESPTARAYNALVQEAICMALAHLPEGRRLRILEIGGGTGGTTAYVLPKLLTNRTEYVFTDVSKLFTAQAKQKFGDYPFVQYELLDIELDPRDQGFASQHFDVIIAANVLHATSDLRQTLGHIQQLLSSEGLLVLLEVTKQTRWLDLVFGLTEGWWKFADVDLRLSYPLLSKLKWQDLLKDVGFKEVTGVSVTKKTEDSDQTVILAQGPQVKPEADNVEAVSPLLDHQGSWLIFADSSGVGQELAESLRSCGETCVMVYPGETYKSVQPGHYQLNPACVGDLRQLVKDALGADRRRCRGVVHLWSLEVTQREKTTLASLEAAQILGCTSVLHLVQAMAEVDWTESPRLWLVSSGTQMVGTELESVSIAQSPLWGLGRVISHEHPEFCSTMVDLSLTAAPEEIQSLLQELWSGDREYEIAFRGDARYVARLVQCSPEVAPPPKVAGTFRSDSTYLITGGLGGLGLSVAQWMVEQGARHLVLMGRNGASAMAEEALDAMKKVGAHVAIAKADVTQEEQVVGVLNAISKIMPPLKGIIHAAGVLDNCRLLQLNHERLATVMRPKVNGAWNLHALTLNMPLDFFVLFSSASSILGGPSQGNYAAANMFLDSLAHYRRSLKLPAVSINWGAWAEVGMVASSDWGKHLAFQGINRFSPKQGVQALEQLLPRNYVQIAVMSVNWLQLLQTYSADNKFSLLSQLSQEETKLSPHSKTKDKRESLTRETLLTVDSKQRQQLLELYFQDLVTKVLGLSAFKLDVQQPLNNLGFDSLMAVELKNRIEVDLGVVVPMTKFLEGSSITNLVTQVLEQLTAAAIILPVSLIEETADENWEEGFL